MIQKIYAYQLFVPVRNQIRVLSIALLNLKKNTRTTELSKMTENKQKVLTFQKHGKCHKIH